MLNGRRNQEDMQNAKESLDNTKIFPANFWSKSTAVCDPCIFEEKNASWQKLIASMVCASFGAKVRCRIMHLPLMVQSFTTTRTHIQSGSWLSPSDAQSVRILMPSQCPLSPGLWVKRAFAFRESASFCRRWPAICIGFTARYFDPTASCLLHTQLPHQHSSDLLIYCKWHMVSWGLGGLNIHSQRWVGIHLPTRVQKRFSDRWLVKTIPKDKYVVRTDNLPNKLFI